ncbi:hypothetical protein CDL15_Pgr024774 [Punica granatum]|uniref:Uncharacterized protein n=1 Tax=Punica granatum TaxID=22663 RepID=A0A218VTQ4_PUNGR|nr:hypothetical protein CDL15_Pgr024774 [Punica granatum]
MRHYLMNVVTPDLDFDEIDNMRIPGNLFYKLDRASKEFEENKFDFHMNKSSKHKEDPKEIKGRGPDTKLLQELRSFTL